MVLVHVTASSFTKNLQSSRFLRDRLEGGFERQAGGRFWETGWREVLRDRLEGGFERQVGGRFWETGWREAVRLTVSRESASSCHLIATRFSFGTSLKSARYGIALTFYVGFYFSLPPVPA